MTDSTRKLAGALALVVSLLPPFATRTARATDVPGSTPSKPAATPAPAATIPDLGLDLAGLPQAVTDVPGVERRIFRDGRVFISGQPSQAALERLKALGVTAVVSLRTPEEMQDRQQVPYDEPAAAQALGLEYVNVPIGGPQFPYRPAVLESLADVLARHKGPVLLHCTVAGRASYVWTAFLVRYQGLDLDRALARGRAIALTEDPLALLLGVKLRLAPVEELLAAPAAPAKP